LPQRSCVYSRQFATTVGSRHKVTRKFLAHLSLLCIACVMGNDTTLPCLTGSRYLCDIPLVELFLCDSNSCFFFSFLCRAYFMMVQIYRPRSECGRQHRCRLGRRRVGRRCWSTACKGCRRKPSSRSSARAWEPLFVSSPPRARDTTSPCANTRSSAIVAVAPQ
jgi:hypothetical protein